jgi:hypothetical protein
MKPFASFLLLRGVFSLAILGFFADQSLLATTETEDLKTLTSFNLSYRSGTLEDSRHTTIEGALQRDGALMLHIDSSWPKSGSHCAVTFVASPTLRDMLLGFVAEQNQENRRHLNEIEREMQKMFNEHQTPEQAVIELNRKLDLSVPRGNPSLTFGTLQDTREFVDGMKIPPSLNEQVLKESQQERIRLERNEGTGFSEGAAQFRSWRRKFDLIKAETRAKRKQEMAMEKQSSPEEVIKAQRQRLETLKAEQLLAANERWRLEYWRGVDERREKRRLEELRYERDREERRRADSVEERRQEGC